MKLIDAYELLRTFTVNSDGQRIQEKDCDNFDLTISLKEIKRIIREQPTAYDLDKVAESLMNRFRVVSNDEDLEWNRAIDYAIKIVKGGGVE